MTTPAITTDMLDTVASGGSMDMWGMLWGADPMVKLVVLVLIFCSIWSWAIILFKYQTVKGLNRASDKFEDKFWSGESLEKLYDRLHKKPDTPMASVFCIGMKEWRRGHKARSGKTTPHANFMQRIDRVMSVSIDGTRRTLYDLSGNRWIGCTLLGIIRNGVGNYGGF